MLYTVALPASAPVAAALEKVADSSLLLLLLFHTHMHMLMQNSMPCSCRAGAAFQRRGARPVHGRASAQATRLVLVWQTHIPIVVRSAAAACLLCPWPLVGVISASTTHTRGRHHNTHRQTATGAQPVETGSHQVESKSLARRGCTLSVKAEAGTVPVDVACRHVVEGCGSIFSSVSGESLRVGGESLRVARGLLGLGGEFTTLVGADCNSGDCLVVDPRGAPVHPGKRHSVRGPRCRTSRWQSAGVCIE